MHYQSIQQITINAPAHEAWRVLAHEFDRIDQWSSTITESASIAELPTPEGAPVGGRVCMAPGFGGNAQEQFTYYDEAGMRFGYEAIGKLPWALKRAENNWAVHALGPNQCRVEFRAEVDYDIFPGILLMPLMWVFAGRIGGQTLEEFKYYVETGQPHRRKLKAQARQLQAA